MRYNNAMNSIPLCAYGYSTQIERTTGLNLFLAKTNRDSNLNLWNNLYLLTPLIMLKLISRQVQGFGFSRSSLDNKTHTL